MKCLWFYFRCFLSNRDQVKRFRKCVNVQCFAKDLDNNNRSQIIILGRYLSSFPNRTVVLHSISHDVSKKNWIWYESSYCFFTYHSTLKMSTVHLQQSTFYALPLQQQQQKKVKRSLIFTPFFLYSYVHAMTIEVNSSHKKFFFFSK